MPHPGYGDLSLHTQAQFGCGRDHSRPLSPDPEAAYGAPLTLPYSRSVPHDLFASSLSLPPTRDIAIAMAVSSHVIHQVHGLVGQLSAEPTSLWFSPS